MKTPIFAGWRQVAICTLNQAVGAGSVVVCFSIVAVSLQKEFEPSRAVLMLTMTVLYLIMSLVSPTIGAAMDRYSLRKILIAGGVFLGAGYIALSFVTSMIHVFVVYGTLLALASAILGPLSYSTLLPRWFVRKRARATGIAVLGMAIGGLVFPPLFNFLIDSFGWRDAMRIFGTAMIVIVVPLIGWLTIDRPADVGLYPDGDAQPPASAAAESAAEQRATMSLLGDMNFWVVTLGVGLVICGSSGVIGNMVPFIISAGFTASQGALVLSCFAAGSFVSKIAYATFGDRLGPRAGLAAGICFFTLSSLAFAFPSAYTILLIGGFLLGAAVGVSLPLWSNLTARVFGSRHVGRVFGLMTIVLTPISLLAAPGLGRVYDLTGSYNYAFMVYVGLGFCTLLFVTRLRITAEPQTFSPATAVP